MKWIRLTRIDGETPEKEWVNVEHLRSLRIEGGGTVAVFSNGDRWIVEEDPSTIPGVPSPVRGPVIGTLDGRPRATKAV